MVSSVLILGILFISNFALFAIDFNFLTKSSYMVDRKVTTVTTWISIYMN